MAQTEKPSRLTPPPNSDGRKVRRQECRLTFPSQAPVECDITGVIFEEIISDRFLPQTAQVEGSPLARAQDASRFLR